MGMVTESTIPDPRGTDHERALFLDLLWDDAIDAQVERRAEAELEKLRSKLISEMDDRRARHLKLDIATIEARKEHIMSEGRYQGMFYGFLGTSLLAFLVAIVFTIGRNGDRAFSVL